MEAAFDAAVVLQVEVRRREALALARRVGAPVVGRRGIAGCALGLWGWGWGCFWCCLLSSSCLFIWMCVLLELRELWL